MTILIHKRETWQDTAWKNFKMELNMCYRRVMGADNKMSILNALKHLIKTYKHINSQWFKNYYMNTVQNGKGSLRRKCCITQEELAERWEAAFGKKVPEKTIEKEKPKELLNKDILAFD